MQKTHQFKGFTLIELIVVIGIIAILAAIVLIAVNPARQFAQGRETQRSAAVREVANAINQHAANNGGNLIAGIAALTVGENHVICKGTGGGGNCVGAVTPAGGGVTPVADGVDLTALTPDYIADLPRDPATGFATGQNTGYTVRREAGNRITICAPNAANEPAIPTQTTAICVTQ